MKRIVTELWQAFDGVAHATEAECRSYERRVAHIRLVGLTIEQVEAALSRADPELADAIEVIGSRISRARLADGLRKHERKDAAAAETKSAEPEFPAGYDPQSYDERVA